MSKGLKKIKELKNIWLRSDSQPTEITLAFANLTMTHTCIGFELGELYVFRIFIFLAGLYQLNCVAKENIDCRVRASVISFSIFVITTILYMVQIGFPTPTHYGWFVLTLASFGSMKRLITEKIYKLKKNG